MRTLVEERLAREDVVGTFPDRSALAGSVLVPLGDLSSPAAATTQSAQTPEGLDGSGTAAEPYLIGTEADLAGWVELLNDGDPAYT